MVLRHQLTNDAPEGWNIWAMPFYTSTMTDSHNGFASWDDRGPAFLGGADYTWNSGFNAGFHLALADREMEMKDGYNAKAEVRSLGLGAHARFAPEGTGFYLNGQARLNLEDSEMDRAVVLDTYRHSSNSDWNSVSASAMLNAGWDWNNSNLTFGPLGWMEYSLLHRPSLDENGTGGNLHMSADNFDSLLLGLGAHVAGEWHIRDNVKLSADLMAAWRHEMLDDRIESKIGRAHV